MIPVHYLRLHPFSVMALCNVVGDCCYLGFAFDAQGWVSLPKLGGAFFTIAAHIILLAYGDDQARQVAGEYGIISRAILGLRDFCRHLLRCLPEQCVAFIRVKPVGLGFAMLALNGVGLLVDALLTSVSWANLSQILLGVCIMTGCGAFALADCVQRQQRANALLKIAPSILTVATVANAGLALTTHNGFMIMALLVFLTSNLAGFYARIDKEAVV